MKVRNKALFLDRDGVINSDLGYVANIEDFFFLEEIFALVRKANQQGYLVIIVTNQSGIGRGYFSEEDFKKLMEWVFGEFRKRECFIHSFYFCPFHPKAKLKQYKKNSNLRKPKPGMINLAIKEHDLDASKSILIGDKLSDITAGISAGINKNLLFAPDAFVTDAPQSSKYHIISSLQEAECFIA